MGRYQAWVEYDGAAYSGFQRLAGGAPTVQGTLESALSRLAQQPVRIVGAGRTDAGVHAAGQVIAFDLAWRHGTEALLRAMNAHLPGDVAVWRVCEAEPAFHPRYDARRRVYAYTLDNRPIRSPLQRTRSWHVPHPLDMEAMNQAAALLMGSHDFATFGTPTQGHSTVREVYRAEWGRQTDYLVFTIEANAFLKRMVRTLVGTMKQVGEGRWSVGRFAAALAACDRDQIETVAPPQGLLLVRVIYNESETGLCRPTGSH